MTNLTKSILAIFTFAFAANISAQTQTAIVGELSQLKFNISNAINTNKCHIEVTLPNQQKVGVEVDGPQFLASVEFTPQQIGNNVIQWEGKNKLRGLKSVFACPGSGVIQVQVNASTEQIAQKWNQYFSSVYEEIRDCVKVGMDLSQLKYQVFADPTVTLTSPQDPKLNTIYEKCGDFARQNHPQKGAQCTLASQNNLKTICDGFYAERQRDGSLKTISRTAAIQLQFEGKPWTVGVLESLDVRTARLKQEEEEKAKQATELNAKQAAELIAKKAADEKERLFKLSPEYKQQQADLETKRIADEKEAVRKQAESERVRIAEARTVRLKQEAEDKAKQAAEELAAKKEAARKQAEMERLRIAEARDRLAAKKKIDDEARDIALAQARDKKKLEDEERALRLAEEKDRKWKASPEYKRQQAEINRRQQIEAQAEANNKSLNAQAVDMSQELSGDALALEFKKLPVSKVYAIYSEFFKDPAFAKAGYGSAVAALEMCTAVQGKRLEYSQKILSGEGGERLLRLYRSRYNLCDSTLTVIVDHGLIMRSTVSVRVAAIKSRYNLAEESVLQDRGASLGAMVRQADEVSDLVNKTLERHINLVVRDHRQGSLSSTNKIETNISKALALKIDRKRLTECIIVAGVTRSLAEQVNQNSEALGAGAMQRVYTKLLLMLPEDMEAHQLKLKEIQSKMTGIAWLSFVKSTYLSCLNDPRTIDLMNSEIMSGINSPSQPTISPTLTSPATTSPTRADVNLTATISCGMGTNNHINVQACFVGGRDGVPTELEITNGPQYGLYKSYNLSELGPEDDAGLNINLSGKYAIKVQNSSKNLTLTLTVRDASGGIRFQRSVGQYGVIRTGN